MEVVEEAKLSVDSLRSVVGVLTRLANMDRDAVELLLYCIIEARRDEGWKEVLGVAML